MDMDISTWLPTSAFLPLTGRPSRTCGCLGKLLFLQGEAQRLFPGL